MINRYNIAEIAAFTGHRSIDSSKIEEVRENVRREIKALYLKGVRIYLCGMALGFDMLAAEEVIALKEKLPSLKLIAVIPFPEQHNRWRWNEKERYKNILAQADDSVLISQKYYDGCYLKRNDYLLGHANNMLAYYNGNPKGGTFYTVRKSRKIGRNVINLFS